MDIPETGAMRTLYDGHAAALRRYVLRLTADRARAEAVVQETLLRACQDQQMVADGQRSPRAWLFTVARNVITETRSSSGNSSSGEQDDPDGHHPALDRMLMADAMAQLSREQRAVVHCAYYRGLSIAQIAAELGIAEGTAKSWLHYALRALRQTLQEMGVAQ